MCNNADMTFASTRRGTYTCLPFTVCGLRLAVVRFVELVARVVLGRVVAHTGRVLVTMEINT